MRSAQAAEFDQDGVVLDVSMDTTRERRAYTLQQLLVFTPIRVIVQESEEYTMVRRKILSKRRISRARRHKVVCVCFCRQVVLAY